MTSPSPCFSSLSLREIFLSTWAAFFVHHNTTFHPAPVIFVSWPQYGKLLAFLALEVIFDDVRVTCVNCGDAFAHCCGIEEEPGRALIAVGL